MTGKSGDEAMTNIPMSGYPPPASSIAGQLKKNKRMSLVIVLVSVAVVLIAVFAFLMNPRSYGAESRSMGGDFSVDLNSWTDSTTHYYESYQEAIQKSNYEEQEGVWVDSDVLLRLESGNNVTLVFYGHNRDGLTGLAGFYFEKHDDSYSEPCFSFLQSLSKDFSFNSFPIIGYSGFSEPVQVADQINFTLIIESALARSNGGRFAVVGLSDNSGILNLTILGQPPTKIVPFDVDGERFYAWYYDDIDMLQYLIDDPTFNFNSYTLDEMVEVLEIRVDG
jgi:hypothetical protein